MTKVESKLQKGARALLQLFGPGGQRWAKDALAYTKEKGGRGPHMNGADTTPNAVNAKSWCLIGGITKLKLDPQPFHEAVEQFTDGNFTAVEEFNDNDGWAPIKKFLTRLATTGSVLTPVQAKAKAAFDKADLAYVAARTALENVRSRAEKVGAIVDGNDY